MSKISVLGLYPPRFLDDSLRESARNGRPALASLVAKEVLLLNQIAYSGYPCYAWISDSDDLNSQQVHRQVYLPMNAGAVSEHAHVVYMDFSSIDSSPAFTTGQGITLDVGGTSEFVPLNYPGGIVAASVWPDDARRVSIETAHGGSASAEEVTITSEEENGPLMASGIFAQAGQSQVDSATSFPVGGANLHSKGNIVARSSLSLNSLHDFLTSYNDVFKRRRPQFGWCDARAGSYVDFTASKTNFRYIFDQTMGAGGTSFSAGGPAITLPLMYTAGGRDTQVRVYVYVYAAMSGATNTGTIGVANKNSSGTMASGASALTNGATISGTSFSWYPSLGSFDGSTEPYFLAYAGSRYDRVALCAK